MVKLAAINHIKRVEYFNLSYNQFQEKKIFQ